MKESTIVIWNFPPTFHEKHLPIGVSNYDRLMVVLVFYWVIFADMYLDLSRATVS